MSSLVEKRLIVSKVQSQGWTMNTPSLSGFRSKSLPRSQVQSSADAIRERFQKRD